MGILRLCPKLKILVRSWRLSVKYCWQIGNAIHHPCGARKGRIMTNATSWWTAQLGHSVLSVRPDASLISWTFVFRGKGFCLWRPDRRSVITTGCYTRPVSTGVCGRCGLCQLACYAKKNRAQGIGRRQWCLKYSIEKTCMLWGWGGANTKVGVFTCIMGINSDLVVI